MQFQGAPRGGLVAVLVSLCLLSLTSSVAADANGGSECAACTIVLQLIFNLMAIDEESFDKVAVNYCTTLPEAESTACIVFAERYGPEMIQKIGNGASADQLCRGFGVCLSPTCNLMPDRTGVAPESLIQTGPLQQSDRATWAWLQGAIEKWTAEHVPDVDLDGDKFSAVVDTMRGAHWRGKDCNGMSEKVYPGRKSSTFPDSIDQDCNGISGRDSLGRSYEKQLCEGSDRRGIISLGDSATAHFRIPPKYLTAADYKRGSKLFHNVLPWGLDEADWPHRSWGTGHLNDTTGDCEGPLDSLYLNLLNRNRCNFRDFQNIGVNGARTSSMAPPGIVTSMARTSDDHPALVVYALVGNDVCSGHQTFSTMTTPEEFETNVLSALDYLSQTLPNGSFVVFVGLAQGEVLWNAMYNRTHPIGATYEEVYDYLNCLQISPCWGWMNSNATVRALTSARARELSAVYPKIVSEHTYSNFKMAYYPFPLPEAIKLWTAQGGQVYELIEPVDGFHPSQQANALVAGILFDKLVQDHPDFVGAINPNNDKIRTIFSDQGGY